MRPLRRGLAAVILMISGADAAHAQSVSGSCAGSTDANGNIVSASAGGCNTSAPSTQSSGPSFTPAQQMQLDAAYGVGSAMGSAFVNWLLAPAPSHEPERQRAIQQLRQRYLGEQQRRERESLRMHEEHERVLGEMKPLGRQHELAAKDLGNAGSLTSEDSQRLEALKNQVRTIDCVMADVYAAAERLGPEGKEYAAQLRQEILEAEVGLAQQSRGPEGHEMTSVMLLNTSETHKRFVDGTQMITNATLDHDIKSGITGLTIDYELSKTGKKRTAAIAKVQLDESGSIDCQQVPKATAKCMAKFNPDSAKGDYCPKPPEPCKDTSYTAEAKAKLGCPLENP